MKILLYLATLLNCITAYSQNIVYFERLNDISNFTIGQGNIEVHTVGVHSQMNVFISYNQNVAGSPVPTGWIPLSTVLLTDVFGTELNAIGVMPSGDTLIKTHQIITSSTSYEIGAITAQGFTAEGQWNNQAWQFQTSFTGPNLNCDAHNVDDLLGFFGGITCVNNELVIDDNAGFFQYFAKGRVLFNLDNSYFSYLIMPMNGFCNPSHLTGTYLNAYIPRVINRPSNELACDGIVHFDRVAMVSDVTLQYSINGSTFAPLSMDQLTNVCANDTIHVIGVSPTITPNDTLVEMNYVLKSVLNSNAVNFDLSRMNIALNTNSSGSNCNNEITLENNNAGGTFIGMGYVLEEEGSQMELLLYPDELVNIPYQCQQRYRFYTYEQGEIVLTNFFSYTILDQNNLTHGNLLDLEIVNIHSGLGDCASGLKVINTGQNIPSNLSVSRFNIVGSVFEEATFGNTLYDPGQVTELNNVCSDLYSFAYDTYSELYIVTDSLQKIGYSNNASKIGIDSDYDGNYEQIYTLNNIDTITHYWEECTNDYALPFTSVLFDENLLNDIEFQNTMYFMLYECNFSLTQNATNIFLPYRDVLAPGYNDFQSSIPYIPYHIVAELYCDEQKSVIKRRRIVLGPDGSIQDIYGGAYSNTQSISDVQFEIFPNPAKDKLNIQSENAMTALSIYDLNGRLLLNKKVNNTFESVNISSLPIGTYIITVEENGFIARKRFVKL